MIIGQWHCEKCGKRFPMCVCSFDEPNPIIFDESGIEIGETSPLLLKNKRYRFAALEPQDMGHDPYNHTGPKI